MSQCSLMSMRTPVIHMINIQWAKFELKSIGVYGVFGCLFWFKQCLSALLLCYVSIYD